MNMIVRSPKVKGQPRAIFFDAAGTLIRLTAPVGTTYAEIARDFGAKADPVKMETAFRQSWKEQPARATIAGSREEDDRPWWRALALGALHRGCDPLPASFDEEGWFDTVYRRYAEPSSWELFPEVLGCLEALSVRFPLGVISNFDRRLEAILSGHGVMPYFQSITISSVCGADKPAAAIFETAVASLGLTPADCLHVGDDPVRDRQGAEAAGMKCFLVDRPKVTLLALTARLGSFLS
jgi:putative hydrolase of the HAD superfamily